MTIPPMSRKSFEKEAPSSPLDPEIITTLFSKLKILLIERFFIYFFNVPHSFYIIFFRKYIIFI